MLEVSGSTGKSEVDDATPKIRDAVISAMSTRYFADLLSSQGKSDLKRSIKRKTNSILRASRVESVYFSDFAMQ